MLIITIVLKFTHHNLRLILSASICSAVHDELFWKVDLHCWAGLYFKRLVLAMVAKEGA